MPHETRDSAAARRQLRAAGLMAGQDLPESQEIAAPPDGMARRLPIDRMLDTARALHRVRTGQGTAEDFKTVRGEWVTHPDFGAWFIGPAGSVLYQELERVGKLNRKAGEDLVYLHRGVLQPQFAPEQIKELYDLSDGPELQRIIADIKRWNPSPEILDSYVTAAMGNDRLFLLFNTAMINLGLWPALTDLYDADRELTEDQQAARLVFNRLLQFLPQQNALMDIEGTAKQLGIPLTMAGARAALEAEKLVESANVHPDVLPPLV